MYQVYCLKMGETCCSSVCCEHSGDLMLQECICQCLFWYKEKLAHRCEQGEVYECSIFVCDYTESNTGCSVRVASLKGCAGDRAGLLRHKTTAMFCSTRFLSTSRRNNARYVPATKFCWISRHTSFSQHVCKISQMKHQLDATLCRFYFCRVTLHVSCASALIRSI